MVKIMENPIKMDDLGVPLFLETPIFLPNGWFNNDGDESHVRIRKKITRKQTQEKEVRGREVFSKPHCASRISRTVCPLLSQNLGSMLLSKELHPAKAPGPMAVTDTVIVMLTKDLQPAKAHSPIAVTDSG